MRRTQKLNIGKRKEQMTKDDERVDRIYVHTKHYSGRQAIANGEILVCP